MPCSRAQAMCWAETSASVQWVATRTLVTPRSRGPVQVVDGADAGQQQRGDAGAWSTTSTTAASIHSSSVRRRSRR